MINQIFIDCFTKLIRILEFSSSNIFRIQKLKTVLKIIKKFDKQITNLNQVIDIKGIGKGSIARIDEILKTGTLAEIKDYDKIDKKSKIIEDIMNVIGIGRITAINLIEKYKIKSAKELKELSDSRKAPDLNEKIKLGLKYLGKFEGNIPRKELDKIYDSLEKYNSNKFPYAFITICGSYRRELPTSSDIDVLLCHNNFISLENMDNFLEIYVKYLHEINFLIDDITDKNIKTKYMGFCKFNNKIRRIDIRYIPLISYFPALMYFTGSYQFNQDIRLEAKKKGYKLNEYGLYDLRTDEFILVLSEQEIFDILEMKYLFPYER
jgi:DNA polymerase/3'-5' exonuclease PolX